MDLIRISRASFLLCSFDWICVDTLGKILVSIGVRKTRGVPIIVLPHVPLLTLTFLFNHRIGFRWMDQEGRDISAASFGIGSAPNCWLPLVNMEDSSTEFDNAGLHRSKDPGAGAITPYHGRVGYATAPIPAGYV